MNSNLINCDEAARFIEQIDDPITRSLVNMAFVHVVKMTHLLKVAQPSGDFDMLFLATALRDFFAEHDVIARALDGQEVGAWFDEKNPLPTSKQELPTA